MGFMLTFQRYPPAIKAGLVVSTPVMNIDFAPTILEFVGVDASASFGVDGISWWADVTSTATSSTSPSLVENRECIISEIGFGRIVVCGSLKYFSNWVEYSRRCKDRSSNCTAVVPKASITNSYPAWEDAEQIYDLSSDPTEQTNLVAGGTQEAFRVKAVAILKKHDADTATASTLSLTTKASTKPPTVAGERNDTIPTTTAAAAAARASCMVGIASAALVALVMGSAQ